MNRLLLIPLVLFLACEDKQEKDCEGVEGGIAIEDCAGICDGDSEVDICGVCGGNGTTPCPLNFSLEDLNPSSETFGVNIGPQFFNGKVTLYYFPYSET